MTPRSVPAHSTRTTLAALLAALLAIAAALSIAVASFAMNGQIASANDYVITSVESLYAADYDSLVANNTFPDWTSSLEGDGKKGTIPGLGTDVNINGEECPYMVPQGLCQADQYILVSATDEGKDCDSTHEKHESVIYVLDSSTGEYIANVVLGGNKSHVGGLASDGENVYIADSADTCVWSLPLSAITQQVASGKDSNRIVLEDEAQKFTTSISPSYVTYYNGMIIPGHNSEVAAENVIIGIDPDTGEQILQETQVAVKSQGVSFAKFAGNTYMLCSSSLGRFNSSSLYVYRAEFSEDNTSLTLEKCSSSPLNFPNMMEDIDVQGTTMLALHESAAKKYQDGDGSGSCPYPIDQVVRLSVSSILQESSAVSNASYMVEPDEVVDSTPSEDNPDIYKTITAHYANSEYETGFEWCDSMLLEDSRALSTDLAKASVVLASSAYSETELEQNMEAMDFSPVKSGTFNYDKTETLDDNDFVGYGVYCKVIEKDGETYALYCVPIRGTHGSADWYSNFNLGTTGNHAGFYTSADQVLTTLRTALSNDEFDADHTVVWTMGHSRGAAVANIVAGKFSTDSTYNSLVNENHVFGYTYACPAVSKNLTSSDKILTNIYNYNNPGDLIPELPRESWGYARYGQTISLLTTQEGDETSEAIFQNMTDKFESVYKETWASLTSTDSYVAFLDSVCVSEKDFFSADNKLLFSVASYFLDKNSGGTTYSWSDWLLHVGYQERGWIFKQIASMYVPANVKDFISQITSFKNGVNDTIVYAETGIADTAGMTEEEFSQWLDENRSAIDSIENEYNLNISTRAELIQALRVMNEKEATVAQLEQALSYFSLMYADTDGEISTAITHGHTTHTYVAWINSMYYGYCGWSSYTGSAAIKMDDNVTSIGYNCFSWSQGPSTIELSRNLREVGEYGLEYKEITVSGNLDSLRSVGGSAFSGTSCSTPFSVGPLDSVGIYAFDGCSALTGDIVLTESVKEVPNYAFENSNISSVEMQAPGVVIGINAFNSCASLTTVTLPCDATYITRKSYNYSTKKECDFSGAFICTSVNTVRYTAGTTGVFTSSTNYLNEDAGDTIKSVIIDEGVISASNFRCEGLESVSLPSTLESLGEGAFEYCKNITSLDLPASLRSVGAYAFASYSGAPISFKNSLDYIGRGAFSGCSVISGDIVLSNAVTEVPSGAFYKFGGTRVVLSSSIESIGNEAFYGCTTLTELTIPKGATLKSVGEAAFDDCDNLSRIYVYSTSNYNLLSAAVPSSVTVVLIGDDEQSRAAIATNCSPSNAGVLSGGGEYNVGDVATITAKAIAGYKFTGWYFDNKLVTLEPTYTFTVANGVCFEARFEANESANLVVDSDWERGSVTYVASNGKYGSWFNFCEYFPLGTTVTLTAQPVDGLSFQCWLDGSTGRVLTHDTELTIQVSYDTEVRPEYRNATMHSVTFCDLNGDLIAMEQVEDGGAASDPGHGSYAGYKFIGWSEPFDNVTSDITVSALYEQTFEVVAPTITGSGPTVALATPQRIYSSGGSLQIPLVTAWKVPDNCTVLDTGLMYMLCDATDVAPAAFTLDDVDYWTVKRRQSVLKICSGTFEYTLTMHSSVRSQVVYARAYVTYRNDVTGAIDTVYSSMLKG